ncbi:MAG: hypothetical protein R6U55_07695, partial [Desulfovermiculus sp.]
TGIYTMERKRNFEIHIATCRDDKRMAGAIRGRRFQGGPWQRRESRKNINSSLCSTLWAKTSFAPYIKTYVSSLINPANFSSFARFGAKNISDLPEEKLV